MTRLRLVLAGLLLTGCARFEPQPLHPDQSAAQLEQRTLQDPGLKDFLEQTLGRQLSPWPQPAWSFDQLTQAALYFHPSLEVARAQWRAARGGEVTAAQRPNPTLTLLPGYNSSMLSPSPWLPLGYVDIPIETAGKRSHRRAQAAHLAEAARLNLASTAWQVR